MSFSSFGLDADLLRGLADAGLAEPTELQRNVLPPALEGRDLLAEATPGNGRMEAFLLPVLARLARGGGGATRALILTASADRALAIAERRKALGAGGTSGAAIVEGGDAGPQERALRKGVDVVVATPAELARHQDSGYASLEGVEVLVLDEADLLARGERKAPLQSILDRLPSSRQSLVFCDRLTPELAQLAAGVLRQPVCIPETLGQRLEESSGPALEEAFLPVSEELKPGLLVELLAHDGVGSALVFTRTKHRANRLAEFLKSQDVACERIHGNRSHGQRAQIFADFREGKYRLLVATDIASRATDVPPLTHVLNFDVPNTADDYTRRVEHTARSSGARAVLTFFCPQERKSVAGIERARGERLPRRTLESFDYEADAEERFEVPVDDRVATMRARKAEDKERSRGKVVSKKSRRRGGGQGPQQGAQEGRGRRRSQGDGGSSRRSAPRGGSGRGNAAPRGAGSRGKRRAPRDEDYGNRVNGKRNAPPWLGREDDYGNRINPQQFKKGRGDLPDDVGNKLSKAEIRRRANAPDDVGNRENGQAAESTALWYETVQRRRGKKRKGGGFTRKPRGDAQPESTHVLEELAPPPRRDGERRLADQQGRPTHQPSFGLFGRRR